MRTREVKSVRSIYFRTDILVCQELQLWLHLDSRERPCKNLEILSEVDMGVLQQQLPVADVAKQTSLSNRQSVVPPIDRQFLVPIIQVSFYNTMKTLVLG